MLSAYYYELPVSVHAVLLALVAHQIFRLRETYSLITHTALLVGPPLALAVHASSSFSPTIWLPTLLRSFATYWAALTLSVLAYRASPFHPLAGYPGPFLNRLSKLRMAFLSLTGKQHEYIQSLHRQYGDVVRIGPNELSVCDPALITPLLGSTGLPKGPHLIGRYLSADTLGMIALQDTDEHLRRRRPWSRAFSQSALKDYEELVATRAKQLVSRLEAEGQRGIVMLDEWINAFTYDFMYDMAFGGGSEMLNGEKNEFWDSLESALGFGTFVGHLPWLGCHLGRIPAASAPIRELKEYCEEHVRRRIESGSVNNLKDLFYYLNNEDEPEKGPAPIQQLADDGILAVVAGSDTVASALSSLFACLMDQPRVYNKLQAEVDQFYPCDENVFDPKHHRDMHYLTAVINETLRLFPSLPGPTQRQVPHNGVGMTAGDIYIPPGTNVWVHAYTMHRDVRNFSPAPDVFWPERWLVASREEGASPPLDDSFEFLSQVQSNVEASGPGGVQPDFEGSGFVHNEAAFMPFSHGPMNCVGKKLAQQEMRTAVCALLRTFDVRPAEGYHCETEKWRKCRPKKSDVWQRKVRRSGH